MTNSETALKEAYRLFLPYSKKYTVDFDRYVFSLNLLLNIPDIKEKKVLDVGTGIGLMPLTLQKLGITAHGLDYYIFPESHNEMFGLSDIGNYQKIWGAQSLKMLNKDIFDPNLAGSIGTYDVILSEATIEHIKDPKKFLEQCRALLKPSGYLLITTPNLSTLTKRLRFLFGRSPYWPIESFFKDGEDFTGHWREYTLHELQYMCTVAGFTVLQAHNKNMLAKFKSLKSWRKNLRALLTVISGIIPGTREMNYVLCQLR